MLFSIVIPTRHRNDLLALCLERLVAGAQTFPATDYEVIVTDDGSEQTAEALLRDRFPFARWVAGPRRGPAANRNNGAAAAAGSWIVFIDDDCIPEPGWLAGLAAAIEADPGLDVLEGKTLTPDKSDNPFREGIENTEGGVYWSCNLAVRADRFRAWGGFDADFLEAGGEDMEFAHRFKRLGGKAAFVRPAVVLHPTRPVPFKRMVWRFRLGRWTRLYDLKVGATSPRERRWRRIAWPLLRNLTLNQLRFTWWFVRDPLPQWRTRLFHLVLGWLLLPVNIPYQIVWDRRFRAQLAARADKR